MSRYIGAIVPLMAFIESRGRIDQLELEFPLPRDRARTCNAEKRRSELLRATTISLARSIIGGDRGELEWNERMNERLVNHSEQEVQGRPLRYREKRARARGRPRASVSHYALSRARNACGHSIHPSVASLGRSPRQAAGFQRKAERILAINRTNVWSDPWRETQTTLVTHLKNISRECSTMPSLETLKLFHENKCHAEIAFPCPIFPPRGPYRSTLAIDRSRIAFTFTVHCCTILRFSQVRLETGELGHRTRASSNE